MKVISDCLDKLSKALSRQHYFTIIIKLPDIRFCYTGFLPEIYQKHHRTRAKMPAPSPLTIATQSVQRLVKEDSYYRKELAQQTERVKKIEEDLKASPESTDENAAYMLKQEQKAIEETRAVFAPLRERIVEAIQRLEEQIATAESESAPADEVTKAKEALTLGRGLEPAVA
ncbi:tubulin binding cofactor A [Nemania sp. FL0031]|nr:tubulin binding cofactor A [Nemania sp. FL0031]